MTADTTPAGAPPTLDGYELFECVGVGGLGAVYRARQLSTGAEVAVKLVRSVDDDSGAWRRTERELRALAGLRGHAHVVGVLEVVPTENYRALVVEFAPGGSINDLVADSGPMDVSEIVFVGRQVAHALESAHERGIVHRDIKPHNLLIDDFGQIKVCDFGVASLLGEDEFRDRTSGLSVRYASPEDVEDEPDVLGPPSDVYSLGATLLFLRRGVPPSILERVAGWVPPEVVGADDDDVGATLDALIADCLRLDPLERPTARALHDRFQDIEARLGRPVTALGQHDDDGDDGDGERDDGPVGSTVSDPPVDGDETFDPPGPGGPVFVDSTVDREMHAEFQAALRAAPPVAATASTVTDDPPGSDLPAMPTDDEDFWGRSEEARLQRPPADPSPMWPRLVVVVLAVVAVVVVAWAIVSRGDKSDAVPVEPSAPPGSSASAASASPAPVEVDDVDDVDDVVEVVARPSGLDDLSLAVWPQAERGSCLVQRPGVAELLPTPCDQPHDLESLGYEEVADGEDGLDDDGVRAAAADLCAGRATGLAEFEGRDQLTIDATVPSAAAWADGDRVIQCWIRVVDRRLVGNTVS